MTIDEIEKSTEINTRVLDALKILMSGQTLPAPQLDFPLGSQLGIGFLAGYPMFYWYTDDKIVRWRETDFFNVINWLNRITEEDRLAGLAAIAIKDFKKPKS